MKKDYTQYDEETGVILSNFTSSAATATLNTPNIEGTYSADEYVIIGDSPVKKDDATIEATEKDRAWVSLRYRRNKLLSGCDWTQASDAPLDANQKTAWQGYRENLRNLPANTEDPRNVVYPTPPS